MKFFFIVYLLKKNIIKIICLNVLILMITGNLYGNPFFGNSKKVPSPAVISGGKGFLTGIQFKYRESISSTLRDIKNGKSGTIIILLTASFLYGLFHAAGPGHRKTILFSLFLSKKVAWYEPVKAGFLSSGLHAGSSILIILGVLLTERIIVSLSGADTVYAYMEGITFIILALMALIFIIIKTIAFFQGNENKINSNNISKKTFYPGIIIASLVPCPGATMILLFALHLDLLLEGIIGIFAMSLGMGIIISIAGYIAFLGREGLFLKLKKNEKIIKIFSSILEIFSFFIILIFSLIMGWPFISFLLK